MSRDELARVVLGELDEVVVEGQPPPAGSTRWLRRSPRTAPEIFVRVLDSWPIVSGPSAGCFAVRVQPVDKGLPQRPRSSPLLVPRDEIGEILDGDTDEIVTQREPPKVGATVPIQSRVGKRASCYVKVLDTWPCIHGGFVVRFELANAERDTRYLRPKGGYTTEPSLAIQDEDEPAEWAPPPDWKDPGMEIREQQHKEREADALEKRLRTVEDYEELVRLKQLARERGVDIRSDMRVIERRIDVIKEKIKHGPKA